jgi:hypothetical protein
MITIEIGPGIVIGSGIGVHITPVITQADLTTENDESLLTESGDNLVVEL